MKQIFEIGQNKIWVRCPTYLKPLCGICLQNGKGLVKIPKIEDLNSVNTFSLCILIKISWECFCMIGQDQNDHLDMVLQSMQQHHGARFRKELLLMPKVGIVIIIPEMTICT